MVDSVQTYIELVGDPSGAVEKQKVQTTTQLTNHSCSSAVSRFEMQLLCRNGSIKLRVTSFIHSNKLRSIAQCFKKAKIAR